MATTTEVEVDHLLSTVATLRNDVDQLRQELDELKAALAEETFRRRTLSSRLDYAELARP